MEEEISVSSVNDQDIGCVKTRREISYLGRLITFEGYTTDPKFTLAVTSKITKKPKTITQQRTLSRFLGYFRRYIPSFSKTAPATSY